MPDSLRQEKKVLLHSDLLQGLALFVLWNTAGFFMVMLDKRRAKRNKRRIRERTFFLWAAAFGAAGILSGMYVFRHKTRHRSFTVIMPLLCLSNLVLGYLLWRRFD